MKDAYTAAIDTAIENAINRSEDNTFAACVEFLQNHNAEILAIKLRDFAARVKAKR